jgi:hypothetical protein
MSPQEWWLIADLKRPKDLKVPGMPDTMFDELVEKLHDA